MSGGRRKVGHIVNHFSDLLPMPFNKPRASHIDESADPDTLLLLASPAKLWIQTYTPTDEAIFWIPTTSSSASMGMCVEPTVPMKKP
ncbi:hypothetical protein INR49_001006 [Caranx melampygus]|nr:hypothetical protein INR49_001006 [Caranx melampygus]